MATKHAVALVPGFLGFNRRRDRTYFADRFISGVRAAVEARCGESVEVIPFQTRPVGSLTDRQARLLEQLGDCDRALSNPQWHLVGHSTGGLDAAFLARTEKLTLGPEGSMFSREPLDFPRLRSVTTLATPHFGTTLALSPIASLVRDRVSVAGLVDAGEALIDVWQRDQRDERIRFALASIGENGAATVLRMLLDNKLATDLTPSVATNLTVRTDNRRTNIPIASIATVAPPPNVKTDDHLFRDLWTWTQEKSADVAAAPPPPPSLEGVTTVSNPNAILPSLDQRANDGVVNTLRQVDPGGAFAALVVGDHGDVVGRYRRFDLVNKDVIDPGLLTSGAQFDDDQFFQLMQVIGGCIARAM